MFTGIGKLKYNKISKISLAAKHPFNHDFQTSTTGINITSMNFSKKIICNINIGWALIRVIYSRIQYTVKKNDFHIWQLQ